LTFLLFFLYFDFDVDVLKRHFLFVIGAQDYFFNESVIDLQEK